LNHGHLARKNRASTNEIEKKNKHLLDSLFKPLIVYLLFF